MNALSLRSGPCSVPHDDPQRQGSPRGHRQLHRRQHRRRRRHDLVPVARGGLESSATDPASAWTYIVVYRADAGNRRLRGRRSAGSTWRRPTQVRNTGSGRAPAAAALHRQLHHLPPARGRLQAGETTGAQLLDLPQLRCWSATPADHDLPPRAGVGRPAHVTSPSRPRSLPPTVATGDQDKTASSATPITTCSARPERVEHARPRRQPRSRITAAPPVRPARPRPRRRGARLLREPGRAAAQAASASRATPRPDEERRD